MQQQADIVLRAIDAAPDCPGLKIGQLRTDRRKAPGQTDGLLTIRYRGKSRVFHVIVKRHLHHALADRLIADQANARDSQPLLVIVDQIADKHADVLMKAGVSFLDTAGNAFLVMPGLHLAVTGRKAPSPAHRPRPARAFQPTGLKLLFAILTDPDLVSSPADALINRRFRYIAQQTGVSLGSVGWILGDLRDSGYIVQDGKVRFLVDRKRLVQKWADNYIDRLYPKLPRRTFKAPSFDWWQNIQLSIPDQLWGGEVAAEKLTGYLRPQVTTVYCSSHDHGLVLDAGLRPDPDGDVVLAQPFWGNWPHAAFRDCTHPLLVYADLLASDIGRNLDTAQRIYDDYVREIAEPA